MFMFYVLFWSFIKLSSAQIPQFGPCPDINVMANFNSTKYSGTWYEAERYFAYYELGGKCVRAEYRVKHDDTIVITNQQESAMTGMRIVVRGEALQQSRSQPAKMLVRVMPVPLDLATPYWVVHTNYDSYSVVWSCNDYNYFHTENAWILTRQREPSLDTLQKAYTIVDENNMSRAYFAKTDHTNCTEIEPEKMLEIV
ncbi:apolipoprotein D [Plutella xylostella]|uniref:apolipoprotein D n=1 Tax=Plutella xylostella TaxID=51655 RepID=UPI002032B5E9|nr:apolipoprotein D [Plutella xylostella]